jgi:hypothetical protein
MGAPAAPIFCDFPHPATTHVPHIPAPRLLHPHIQPHLHAVRDSLPGKPYHSIPARYAISQLLQAFLARLLLLFS